MILDIPPKVARTLLAREGTNREMRGKLKSRYATSLSEKRWQLNGETVKVATTGAVIDGQHRLQACVEANTTFRTFFAGGLDPESFQTIDVGLRRQPADILAMRGYRYSHALAAAAANLYRHERNSWAAREHVDPQELLAVLERHPGMMELAPRAASRTTITSLLRPSVAVFSYYVFHDRDPVLADQFLDAIQSGADLRKDDPFLLLRERLVELALEARGRKVYTRATGYIALCFRAWNMKRQHETVRSKTQAAPFFISDTTEVPELV
jgi:hypothetical protein